MTYWLKDDNEIIHIKKCGFEGMDENTEKTLKQLRHDLNMFQRANPKLTSKDMAEAFCKKWQGYRRTYGEEFILNIIEAPSINKKEMSHNGRTPL